MTRAIEMTMMQDQIDIVDRQMALLNDPEELAVLRRTRRELVMRLEEAEEFRKTEERWMREWAVMEEC